MTRTLTRWQSLLLGLILLVGLTLGGIGLFAVGSRGWYGGNALHVRAGFAEIRGVEVGTRVRIQGIDAGEVVAITPPDGPDSPVLLRLRIRGDYRHLVRVSTTVQIVPEGMLGGKVVELRPPARKPSGPAADLTPAEDDALLTSEASTEIGDVLGHAGVALQRLPGMVDEAVTLFRSTRETAEKGKETLGKIDRAVEATKELPLVGGAFKGATDILVRERGEWERRVFAEGELFEPGRAVLTASGRERLDELGDWLRKLRHSGSEVVVVSYADPRGKQTPEAARLISRQQSETVLDYLKTAHAAHKLAWYAIGPVATRKVIALGMGHDPAPKTEPEPLPPARVEVCVYKPQS
ncbi:MAG: MlaD family protein [Gemmataceae bacterium]